MSDIEGKKFPAISREEINNLEGKDVVFAEYVNEQLAKLVLTPSSWIEHGDGLYQEFAKGLGYPPDDDRTVYAFNFLILTSIRQYQENIAKHKTRPPEEYTLDRNSGVYVKNNFKIDGKPVSQSMYLEWWETHTSLMEDHAKQGNMTKLEQKLEELRSKIQEFKEIEYFARIILAHMRIPKVELEVQISADKNYELPLSDSGAPSIGLLLIATLATHKQTNPDN